MFFFEKKNQKTFVSAQPTHQRRITNIRTAKKQKSFASFLQKRRILLF